MNGCEESASARSQLRHRQTWLGRLTSRRRAEKIPRVLIRGALLIIYKRRSWISRSNMADDQKTSTLEKGKLLLIGTAIGALIGGVGALFLAQESGEELKEDIKKATEKLLKELKERVEAAEEMSKEKFDELIEELLEKYTEVKELGEEKIEELREVLEEKWEEFAGD